VQRLRETELVMQRPGAGSTTGDSQGDGMTNRSTATSIDAYIAEFPPETQEVLRELRAIVKSAVPGATETMSYAIPTFDLGGRHLVFFAGYRKHVSLYPIIGAVEEAFADELAPHKHGRGTLQFPLGQPLPTDLIGRIVTRMAQENVARATK